MGTLRTAAWWSERNLPGQTNPDLAPAQTPWTAIVDDRKRRASGRRRARSEARGARAGRRRQFGRMHARIVQAGRLKDDDGGRDRALSGKARIRARKANNRARKAEDRESG